MSTAIITLTTDFGDGPFAGLMKGVILSLAPKDVRLVDLSHAIPAQDVRAGALVLEMVLGVFPAGTVHLAVVDPGVGTARRPVCVKAADQLFVGPDNGLFTPAYLADSRAETFLLAREDLFRHPVSRTFHGRDIFAPVAARLAGELDPAELGPVVNDPVLLDWPRPHLAEDILMGAVLGADSFGNLDTNLGREEVEGFLGGRPGLVRLDGMLEVEGISQNYGQAAPGEMLALYDSSDRLELAQNQGDLRAYLGLKPGQVFGLEVTISRI